FLLHSVHLRYLHPSPTRRSSDLRGRRRHLHRADRLAPPAQPPFTAHPDAVAVRHAPALRQVIVSVVAPELLRGDRIEERRNDRIDRKSTRLNYSHEWISYAVFCL